MNPIKNVFILTGFLGAGKTSFLNFILKNRSTKRYAIIENEIGQIGIDADLVLRADDDLIEMNNGCLCCTLNDNLYDILNQLQERKNDFDDLVIECTGIADPASIAEAFIAHPFVKKDFDLKAVICLVDAEQIEMQVRETEEAIKQITFSDILLVNKTDLVSGEQREKVVEILANLQPTAKIFIGHKEDYPLEEILSFEREELKNWQNTDAHICNADCTHAKAHVSTHKHGEIQAVSFQFDKLFDTKYLAHRLQQYIFFQSKDLFRFKSIVAGKDESDFLIFQAVGKRLNIEVGKDRQNDTTSRFVFIGKNIEAAPLAKMLNQCLDKPRIEF